MGVHFFTEYEKEVKRTLTLWSVYQKTYSTLREEYKIFSKQANDLGLNFTKVPSEVKKEWPKIPFLLVSTVEEAERFLREKDSVEIHSIARAIESLRDNYSYNTYRAYTADLKYLVKNSHRRAKLGFDPNYPKTAAPYRSIGSHRKPEMD